MINLLHFYLTKVSRERDGVQATKQVFGGGEGGVHLPQKNQGGREREEKHFARKRQKDKKTHPSK